jgi:hypothetical protein
LRQEVTDLLGKLRATLSGQDVAGFAPGEFDDSASLDELTAAGSRENLATQEFSGYRLAASAGVNRIPPLRSAIDPVLLVRPVLAPHRALCGICSNALVA